MIKSVNEIQKALAFIKNWQPSHEHPEWKSALGEANWYLDKIGITMERIEGEREAFHKLLDCEISVENRPKGLPDLYRVYQLVKKDCMTRTMKYNKMVRMYMNIAKLFRNINFVDGHFFEALAPSKSASERKYRYEKEIETTGKWYIPPTESVESIQKLFTDTGDSDLQDYAIQCVPRHTVCSKPFDRSNLVFFRGIVYFGRSRGGRPLFSLVELHAKYGEKIVFPKEWRIVYIREWRTESAKKPAIKEDSKCGR